MASLSSRIIRNTNQKVSIQRATRSPGDIVITTLADFNASFSFWGTLSLSTPSIGQTFIAPANNMISMTFGIDNDPADGATGTPFDYKAYVYEWDPSMNKIIGSPLFESGTITLPVTAGYIAFTVDTPNTKLNIGNTYIAFFSTSGLVNPADLGTLVAAVAPGTYTDGELFSNDDPTFDTTWKHFTRVVDLAFEFVFNNSIPCLHPDTRVLCDSDSKPISWLRAGDLVTEVSGKKIPILYNMRFDVSDDFICVSAGALGPNIPEKDLIIRKGHPILLNNKEIDPAKLITKVRGVKKVKLDSPVPVWSLCTKTRAFVMMEGVPVATWGESCVIARKLRFTKL